MKRRDRTINVFNISMLDVISGALGAFLIIMIVLMPYYRKEHIDYRAEIQDLKQALDDVAQGIAAAEARADRAAAAARAAQAGADSAQAQTDRAQAQARAAATRADRAQAQTDRAQAQARAAAARADRARAQTDRAQARARAAAARADTARVAAGRADNLDIMIALDVTGSMEEELDEIRSSLRLMASTLRSSHASLRIGLVAYRDRGDDPRVVEEFPLTVMDDRGVEGLRGFLGNLEAGGGSGGPGRLSCRLCEAVDLGLEKAAANQWRSDAQGLIFLVGDQPPHPRDVQRALSIASSFAASGPDRRVSAMYAGPRGCPPAEFFRRVAQAGRGELEILGGSCGQ